jgi:hypothetical protein
MPYLAYKLLHLIGILMLFVALGGAVVRSLTAQQAPEVGAALKKHLAILHGVALLIVLVAGFGLLARLGLGFPGWAVAKLVIWLLLGGILVLINRNPSLGAPLWYVCLFLGAIAAYLALYKPF